MCFRVGQSWCGQGSCPSAVRNPTQPSPFRKPRRRLGVDAGTPVSNSHDRPAGCLALAGRCGVAQPLGVSNHCQLCNVAFCSTSSGSRSLRRVDQRTCTFSSVPLPLPAREQGVGGLRGTCGQADLPRGAAGALPVRRRPGQSSSHLMCPSLEGAPALASSRALRAGTAPKTAFAAPRMPLLGPRVRTFYRLACCFLLFARQSPRPRDRNVCFLCTRARLATTSSREATCGAIPHSAPTGPTHRHGTR